MSDTQAREALMQIIQKHCINRNGWVPLSALADDIMIWSARTTTDAGERADAERPMDEKRIAEIARFNGIDPDRTVGIFRETMRALEDAQTLGIGFVMLRRYGENVIVGRLEPSRVKVAAERASGGAG